MDELKHEILADSHSNSGCHHADSAGHTRDSDGSDEDDFDASNYSADEKSWADTFVLDQNNYWLAQDAASPPDDTPQQDSTGDQPGRKPKGKRVQTEAVGEDSFDDEAERLAFVSIRDSIYTLVNAKSKATTTKTVAWLFGGAENEYGLDFALCCQALDVRDHILLTRIHYEFWLRWMVFSFEFPFEVTPIPLRIRNEIRHIGGQDAMYLAQEAWIRPGVTTAELLMKAAGVDSVSKIPRGLIKTMEELEEKHIISRKSDNWYLTSRNPILHAIERREQGNHFTGGSYSWSRLF